MGALSSCSLESQSRSITELIETREIFFKEPYITNPVSLSGRISVCFPLVSVWIAYGCSEMGSLFQGITFI